MVLVGALMSPVPLQAQFGGKPKIPDEMVLNTYSQAVVENKLQLAPVSTGLAALTQGAPANDIAPGVNPQTYRNTVAALQSYVVILASKGPRPDIVPRVRLEGGLRPNAYAPSQEEIVISLRMLEDMAGDGASQEHFLEQLLFILGHEYGHVLFGHPQLFAEKDKSPNIGKAFATAISVALILNDVSTKVGGNAVIDKKAMGTIQGAYALSPLIEMEVYRATYAPYKKQQESIADFASADLMQRIEFGDVRSASKILAQFETYDNSLLAQLKAGLKQLGSDLETTMTAFQSAAPATLLQSGPRAVVEDAKKSFLTAIVRTVGDFLRRRFSKDKVHLYFSADKRIEGIQQYADRFHPQRTETASAVTQSVWAAKQKVPNAAAFLKTFETEYGPDKAAAIGRQKLLAGDHAGARVVLDEAKKKYAGVVKVGKGKKAKTVPGNIASANFNMVDAETYLFEGLIDQAAAAYKIAIAQPEAPLGAWLSLAAVHNLQGQHPAAIGILDQAGKKFGEEGVVVAKIRHFVTVGQRDKAEALVADCERYPAIVKRCRAALPDVDLSDDDED